MKRTQMHPTAQVALDALLQEYAEGEELNAVLRRIASELLSVSYEGAWPPHLLPFTGYVQGRIDDVEQRQARSGRWLISLMVSLLDEDAKHCHVDPINILIEGEDMYGEPYGRSAARYYAIAAGASPTAVDRYAERFNGRTAQDLVNAFLSVRTPVYFKIDARRHEDTYRTNVFGIVTKKEYDEASVAGLHRVPVRPDVYAYVERWREERSKL
jgi:hypothetical protein